MTAREAQDFVERAAGANLEVVHELAGGLLTGLIEFLNGEHDFLVARGQVQGLPPGVRGRTACSPAPWLSTSTLRSCSARAQKNLDYKLAARRGPIDGVLQEN